MKIVSRSFDDDELERQPDRFNPERGDPEELFEHFLLRSRASHLSHCTPSCGFV
jgi:hypothetical protein